MARVRAAGGLRRVLDRQLRRLRRRSGGRLTTGPEVTLFFWIIKIMCMTVGETAADYLNINLGFGLINTTYFTGALLAVILLVQFRLRRYVPVVYWAAVVVISVFGTLITDNLSDNYNVPLTTTTPICAAILAVVFAVWYGFERTLSIHTIVTTRREATRSRSRSSAARSPSSRSCTTSCPRTATGTAAWASARPARRTSSWAASWRSWRT
ncbi:MAG TPA: hypothetical protein VI318_20100 [Baekduia sp.]